MQDIPLFANGEEAVAHRVDQCITLNQQLRNFHRLKVKHAALDVVGNIPNKDQRDNHDENRHCIQIALCLGRACVSRVVL